jgi:RNA polymerase sigma-70 factor (sigma-E family)
VRKWDVEQQPEGFAEFYQQSRDGCLRAVYASVGDLSLAEDLVAEAFSSAWASWRKGSRHPAPRAWVVRTALNTHVSWWRRRRREVAWNGHDAAGVGDADALLDEQIVAAIRGLPARQREVIILRVFLDLDTEITARALGIAPGTVTAHLSRATAALRGQLAVRTEQEAAHHDRAR